jgi:tRNA (uracil-5-)-methyltransferase
MDGEMAPAPSPEAAAAPPAEAAAAAAAAADDNAADDGPDAKRRRLAAAVSTSAPAARDGVAGGTLVVRQLPARWDAESLRSLLTGTGAHAASVRKKRGERFGFITFGFLADRLRAEAELPKHAPDGRALTVADAGPKGGGGGHGGGRGGSVSSAAAAATRAQRDVRDAVCPLWSTPYPLQLVRKRDTVARALTQLAHAVRRASRGGAAAQPAWLRGAAAAHGGKACALEGIVASPVLHGYRNKVEFTLGPDASGAPTVGFNIGLFSEGFAAVAAPAPCANVSPAAKAVAAWVQAHLRERSALPVWDKRDQTGFWRLLVVREGGMAQCSGAGWRTWLHTDPGKGAAAEEAHAAEATASEAVPPPPPVLPLPQWCDLPPPAPGAEVLLLLQANPAGRDAALVRRECADLAAALRAAAAAATPPMPLGALLLQLHEGCSNAAEEDAPVMALDDYRPLDSDAPPPSDADADADAGAGACASGVLHERLFAQRFRVSPTAFFQVNTAAAEALYELAGAWAAGAGDERPGGDANSHSDSVLYDVCCGTGTIGLTLAHRFASVVGVDICAAAVRDAAANAAANGVANARFEAGRAEDVLPRVLAAAPRNAAAVAIVDPPRGGLHRSVLSALRATAGITRLVYISCNVDSMAVDAAQLCAPGGGGAAGDAPFRPVRAMALDLFPHTKHVEAVLLLERDGGEGEEAAAASASVGGGGASA